MQQTYTPRAGLDTFLKDRNLQNPKRIAKGWSSLIYTVETEKGEKRVVKIEREDSPRQLMSKKEVEYLQLANTENIGPELIDFDLENGIILMEYIDGVTFSEWLFEKNPSTEVLQSLINSLKEQTRKLDKLHIYHGQLAGKGKNILVQKNNEPVIIDFEKASIKEFPRNEKQLKSYFFNNPNGAVAKKIKEILEK